MFTGFMDFEKTFERVQHDKLVQILQSSGIVDKDLRIIKKSILETYCENSLSKEIILRGVWLGCLLHCLTLLRQLIQNRLKGQR